MYAAIIIMTTTTSSHDDYATRKTVILSKRVAMLQGCYDADFSISIVSSWKEAELPVQISLPSQQGSGYPKQLFV